MAKKAVKVDTEAMRKQALEALGLKSNDKSVSFADEHVAITDVISTGILSLDKLLTPDYFEKNGVGGIPRGFICEFFGPEAGGKSFLCTKLAATCTKKKQMVLWIDAENSYVPEWGAKQGIDNHYVVHVENTGQTGEEFLELAINAANSGSFALIVIDSITALEPKVMNEKDLDDKATIGAAAQMFSRGIKRAIPAARNGNTTMVFINQIRMQPGVMYGNPETTPGGKALKFYASIRLRLHQIGSKEKRGIFRGEELIGIRSVIKNEKNRFGRPHEETIMPIYYSAERPLPFDMIIDIGIENKIIKAKTSKSDTGEDVTKFTMKTDKEKIEINGIEQFKAELIKKKAILNLIKQLEELKVNFEYAELEYIKSLKETEDVVSENQEESGDESEPANEAL